MEQPLLPLNDKSSFCPFSLKTTHLDRMINMEFVNHPVYSGLEIQGHNDENIGTGLVVFLQRKQDQIIDLYYEPTLNLPSSWKKLFTLGKGLGLWKQQAFELATLDVSEETGVHANVLFRDVHGQLVHVQVDDDTPFHKTQRKGMTRGFLAPVSAAIENPTSMLLVYLTQFDLVRRPGPAPNIEINGQTVSTGQIPLERCLWGTRTIKVAKDLIVVQVNPDIEKNTDHDMDDQSKSTIFRDSNGSVKSITSESHGHCAAFWFEPAFPDPSTLETANEHGSWKVDIDGDRIVSGTWKCDILNDSKEDATEAKIQLDVTKGWRPTGLPWLTTILFAIVSVFKTWPETYCWFASLQWKKGGAKLVETSPAMVSHWERTSGDRGECYSYISGGGRGNAS
ncbi:hypothetical protein IV203_018821 [Nitzschia inconspicua]|uniref:Uncharacterized protein n=1 Tax=Nitzschia inconspicua TaxID=303405 RepID=A0A9K3M2Q4_9STRA|nr:hypothetical protein IV203_018821 [Nitzschia inconspicua]